jgi:DnaK suppressor protein
MIDLKKVREELEATLLELSTPCAARVGIKTERLADSMDDAVAAKEREINVGLVNLRADKIEAVRAAIDRVDDGTYGVCVDCAELIAPRRLQLFPASARCVSCQSVLEVEENGAKVKPRLPSSPNFAPNERGVSWANRIKK